MSLKTKLRNAFLAAAASVALVGGAAVAAEPQQPANPPAVTKTATPVGSVCRIEETFDEAAKIKRIYDFDLGVVIYKQEGANPALTAVPFSTLTSSPAALEKLQSVQKKLPAGCPDQLSNPLNPLQ
jgi:hypothetical protein